MLGFLFRGLTAEQPRGAALFDALTAEARKASWYLDGAVPDTLDGRFAVLATLTALALVRLERDGDKGNRASVALTERFVEVMESEHRELGLGDPTLGRTVRRLVSMLARRTESCRAAVNGHSDWSATAQLSLYNGEVPAEALAHGAAALRAFADRLDATELSTVEQGKIG